MDRVQLSAAAAVLLVAGLAGWWFGASPSSPPPLEVSVATDPQVVTVHVAGAVGRPGLVTLETGARVADAIAVAGGFLQSADPSSLNLAATVVDGQQILVRGIGEMGAAGELGRIPVNTADVAQLEQITGVGPVLAERIVSHREEHGPFAEVEDLLDVPGIGEAKLASIRDSVAVP